MPTIKSTYSYGSKSQNNDGLWYLDHDSEMWMTVVEQLVLDSKSLLVGKNFDDADPMERPFKRLNDVLVSAGRARRSSITEGQIETHVEGVNKYIAVEREKERLLNEEEDRKRQIADEEQRKRLTPDNFPLDMSAPKKVGGPQQVGGKPKGRPKFVPF